MLAIDGGAIGRTPIREALKQLALDGLVTILPRRGILVSEINLRIQLRLLEVHRELERLMARGAAERAILHTLCHVPCTLHGSNGRRYHSAVD